MEEGGFIKEPAEGCLEGHSPATVDGISYAIDLVDELVERVHAKAEEAGPGSKSGMTPGQVISASSTDLDGLARLLAGPWGLGTSAARLAKNDASSGSGTSASFDVLWTRKRVAGSQLARHIAAVSRDLEDAGAPGGPAPVGQRGWTYDPEAILHAMSKNPAALGLRYESSSHACAEMVGNGRALLAEIRQVREVGHPPSLLHRRVEGRPVWRTRVTIGADAVGALLARARLGANAGRTTKSKLSPCAAEKWADVMDTFGLRGVAKYPNFALGPWWMTLLADEYQDWRQDYLGFLDCSFYLEYNVDATPLGGSDPAPIMRDLLAIWDMPDLPVDLQVRRMHMAADMAFFDTKRKHEAEIRDHPTDGLTCWVHSNRDRWRDFKALDSGIFAHFMSFADGAPGRDDMLLTGLVNDWVDLGPDLRYEECNQAVLALTRGSLVMSDLLDCYERTVWMLNSQLGTNGVVRSERYAACIFTIGACVWEMCNHRQDLWRYYALAFDLCREAKSRELYAACQLADCYTPVLEPTRPNNLRGLRVARRKLRYAVQIGGKGYSGTAMLHTAVCDAVEDGILPMSAVEYEFILPLLLREHRIPVPAFLEHMDDTYCDHFAAVIRAGHACNFSRVYGRAVAALVMEQWWNGIYFAIGAGSLVEAQPDLTAGDRVHKEHR